MLRWAGGLTYAERLRNEYHRKRFKIRPIEDILREERFRCYGHVTRRLEGA